ncbi:MAG: class I SAM-dependent methyltransferase, partial [Thermoleophilaceae bacterium]
MAAATRARIWLGARRRSTRLEAPAGVSGRLAEFVAELPHERGPIVVFVRRAAASIPAGSRVLDAGAGDAPYRELFRHVDYVTADWPNSVHEGAQQSDVVASLDDLPLDDATFDAVVCTQVLEHLEEPLTVLRELARVSKPGATLWITVPLVWPIHEAPFDFFRYTPYSLASLLTRSGFADVDVRAR